MAEIELKNIEHVYKVGKKETWALKGVNMVFEDGVAGALLGPSGCGKTTLLNIISGLIKPTRGKVIFNGKDVTDLPPEERNIAQLFQFPVVYDTMNVFGNLAFPLKNKGMATDQIKKRVEEIAELLGLSKVLHFPIRKLGPGEKQLVALGRGIVRKDTTVILLDEPMTQIDFHKRWVLRRELSKVQSELKITTIYVTHDQYEALTFAEKIFVMKDGLVEQEGSPEELYYNPKTTFVGYFIGTPGMNFIECELKNGGLYIGKEKFEISRDTLSRISKFGVKFKLGIRPEFVHCSTEKKSSGLIFNIKAVEDMGAHKILTLEKDGVIIKSIVSKEIKILESGNIWITFPEDKVRFYKDNSLIL